MRRTPKALVYLALLGMLFFAGDRTLAWLLDKVVSNSQFRYPVLYRGGLSYEILVVGDSRAVHSVFAPEMSKDVCMSVFNAGYNGMSGDLMEALTLDYLDHNAPPAAVLIEVSNVTKGPNLVNEMRPFARGHLRELMDHLLPMEAWWTTLSHLYRFDNEMTLRAIYYRNRSDQDWIMGGPPMSDDVISHLKHTDWDLNQASFDAIIRLAHELKDRGIKPILYVAPFHPVFGKLDPEYAQVFRELSAKLGPEFPIIDLSISIQENRYFADVLHTNIIGSRIVMSHLTQELNRSVGNHCAQAHVD